MTPEPITVSPDLPMAEAIEQMRQDKVYRYPMMDKKGRLIGRG